MIDRLWNGVKHWSEIALWAIVCLAQEIRGEEPDCPDCWKCESMRVIVLCLAAFTVTHTLKEILL